MFYKKEIKPGKTGEYSSDYIYKIYWEQISFGVLGFALIISLSFYGIGFFIRWYDRYQIRQDANNEVLVNEIRIRQQEQLIQVEKQKADIRVQEALGISEAQKIINATLTNQYLQHEAIQAQEKMANSPNHTTIYIPSGNNGIPIINTINPNE
jgi:hypothetical protein